MQATTSHAHVSWQEPAWLLQYRERNAAIVKAQPLQKSKYSNLAFLEKLSNNPAVVTAQMGLPEGIRGPGVKVLTWEEALKTFETELKTALERESPPKDQFEAKINAEFNTGCVICIGGSEANGLVLTWKTPLIPSNALAKCVIIIDNNINRLQLCEKIRSNSARYNRTVLVKENSMAFFASLLDFDGGSIIGMQNILLQDSQLLCANAWMGGTLVRARITNTLHGPGSSVTQRDWNLGGFSQRLDLDLLLLHKNHATKSHSVFKAVLDQQAYSVFEGMIKILPQGQQTTAFLEAYGMLLSSSASCNNIPGLEIQADDVKATHSASVSHLEDEVLFYLLSRGVDEKTAKEMIVMGFLEALVHELPPALQAPFVDALEQKWGKIADKN